MKSTSEIWQEIQKVRERPEKQYARTTSIHDCQTPLNFKRVDIVVDNGLVKEGGIFSASYMTYNVSTSSPDGSVKYDVRRKDADFLFLRKHLKRCFPHIIIPPCPEKQPKLIADRIKRRERYYSRFLQAVARCEELKSNGFLISFLSEKDLKLFTQKQKDMEKQKEKIRARPFT